MSERRPGDTKYAPLLRHLQALPAGQDAVTLSLAEIEVIIGAALPPGARTPGFWTSQSSLWRVGWRVALSTGRDAVRCSRGPLRAGRKPRLDDAAIIATYQTGASPTAVAARLGINRTSVYQVLRRAGIPLRGRGQAVSDVTESSGHR
jgi:hypothetical protein